MSANDRPNQTIQSILEQEMREIGSALKKTRKAFHITQERMSEETGLAEKTIRDFENGKKCPSYDTIVIMSSYLRTNPDCFFPSRLSAGCTCDDSELAEIVGEIQRLDEEKKKTVKSFLRTYLIGAKRLP